MAEIAVAPVMEGYNACVPPVSICTPVAIAVTIPVNQAVIASAVPKQLQRMAAESRRRTLNAHSSKSIVGTRVGYQLRSPGFAAEQSADEPAGLRGWALHLKFRHIVRYRPSAFHGLNCRRFAT